MNSEHVTDRLDAYVDGTLPDSERVTINEHVAVCDSCAAALRSYDPVDLDGLQHSFEDDGLQRTVRRALRRTAVDAAALTVIVLVVGVLLSLFIIQPLLINRSDRAAVAARAMYEAPMLFNPGVEVPDFRIASGLMDRNATSSPRIQLGTGTSRLDQAIGRIGLFRLQLEWRVGWGETPVGVRDVLPGLDDGTVVTVAVVPPTPLSVGATQALADDPDHDVRLTWVGFDVMSSVFGPVGYPLCMNDAHIREELFASSSAGFSGSGTGTPPSVQRALDSARYALDLMASQREVAAALGGDDGGAIESLAASMPGERHVTTVVVTGPTPEVVAFLDDLGVDDGEVLAVGFYSWGSPVCGR
jgi:hypothetical protein